MSDNGCRVVGPHFKSGAVVRIKGVRGKGTIVGGNFRCLIIEYTEYKVQIGNHVHTAVPADLLEIEPPRIANTDTP